jgi:ABC-type phosphate transport system substrate-binding protein
VFFSLALPVEGASVNRLGRRHVTGYLMSVPLAHALGLGMPIRRAWANVDLAVIGNADVPQSSLSKDELAAIFSGVLQTWKNGKDVRVLNLATKSPERVLFDKVIMGMSPEQNAQYWIERRIRGEGTSPKQIPSSDMMVAVIKALSGAVGYVNATALKPDTRVLARIQNGKVVAP